MVDGLPFFNKRSDDIVYGLELAGSKVEAIPGTDQSAAVFLVSGSAIIKPLFKVTVSLFVTGITKVNRRVQKRVALHFYVIRAVRFCLMASLTLIAASSGAAYMFKGAVRGV